MSWWQALVSEGLLEGIRALLSWLDVAREQKQERETTILMDRERRQATQQAYTHWRKLVRLSGGEDGKALAEAARAAQAWHDENCLYLAPEARKALQNSIILATNHPGFLAGRDADLVIQNWQELMECGSVIERSMDEPVRANKG